MDKQNSGNMPADHALPWYRQFWPWFIIALPATAVVAGFLTLWIAMNNPDHLVIDEDEYSRVKSGLKAETVEPDTAKDDPAGPGSHND